MRAGLRLGILVALAGFAFGTRAELPAEGSPPCHPHKASNVERSTATYVPPAVTLVDQRGEHVELRAILSTDRAVALNFIFTSCRTVCPVLSASLASLHRDAGDEVDFISISIDPEFDTPRVLKEYAKRFDVGPGWMLLTGKAEDVAAVLKVFDAAVGGKDAHRPLTFLRPAGAAEWTRLDGFPSTSELLASLRLKTARASP